MVTTLTFELEGASVDPWGIGLQTDHVISNPAYTFGKESPDQRSQVARRSVATYKDLLNGTTLEMLRWRLEVSSQ